MKDIDFRKMTRGQMIQALNIHPETFDAWAIKGAPVEDGEGRSALYDIGKVLEWRVNREKEAKKNDPKNKPPKKEPSDESDPESLLKQKISLQELRKKTRENDEADGLLVNKKEMDNLFFNLGKNLRQNLMSKPPVYGPQCEGKSGFEITNYLLKEFERLLNSISGLEGFIFDDEAQAYELHEMFIKGYNYGKSA